MIVTLPFYPFFFSVQVLRPDGTETEADELGEIFIKLVLLLIRLFF